MAVITLKSFGGIAPATPPRYLDESQAQVAVNSPVWRGSLSSLADVGSSIRTLAKNTVPETIYRFGQNNPTDDRYWFHWPSDVDICRSQIAGDASEWTFFTGDGGPKATYNAIALGSSLEYPTTTRPLGLPAPTNAAAATANAFIPTNHPAEVVLTPAHIDELTTQYDILISVDDDDAADYTTVALTSPIDADQVRDDINSSSLSSGLTATSDGNSVTITKTATGPGENMYVKFQTGSEPDLDGTFSKDTAPNLSASGTADTDAYVVITDSEIGSIGTGDEIQIKTEDGNAMSYTAITSASTSAGSLATMINNAVGSKLTATAYGSSVVITSQTQGDGKDGFIQYNRKEYRASGTKPVVANIKVSGSEQAAPARIFLTQANIDSMEGQFLWLKVNSDVHKVPIPDTAYVNQLTSLNGGYNISVQIFGSIEPFAVLETNAVGTGASLQVRTGDYPNKAIYTLISAEGYEDEDNTTETRVYTYTWINKESGFEFESAPAPASNPVDVKTGQEVSVSGMDPVPGGTYVVTHRRVYRAVSGVYLFVKEIPAANTSFTDAVIPDELGEQLPSLTWTQPPTGLRGLTNLPNGLMAGFVGRDIYFCDPYHPHAWPEQYIQSIDYPIVGLAAMDTTLAVLTTGVPYFIQGTHPEAMAVVKSDLKQSCVSKRSIVEIGDTVLYASPDGLMALSPQGSKVVTSELFNYAQWQEFFNPESIHAYTHDNQYIAFYSRQTPTVLEGGFIYDLRSGNFITHDIYATAGFQDLQTDKFYVAFSDRSLKIWGAGAVKPYEWKSKVFTAPSSMSFSVAQVEAENYSNLTFKMYLDGTLLHTQTVSSRDPFRLPAKRGRDFEFAIEGDEEVFQVSLAHSMTELAGV